MKSTYRHCFAVLGPAQPEGIPTVDYGTGTRSAYTLLANTKGISEPATRAEQMVVIINAPTLLSQMRGQ